MAPARVASSFAGHPTAAVLVIGDEILSGRTQDSNVAFLGHELTELGIVLAEVRIVGDVEAAIVEALNALRGQYDYVFTTGGIGPTHDDITTAAVAAAFGTAVVRDAEAEARLRSFYAGRGITDERLKMADVPRGAELIDNPVSAAPGYRIENVFVLAGIPDIMQAMFHAASSLISGGARILSETITVAHPESRLAPGLSRIQADSAHVTVGSYPFLNDGRPETRVVIRSADAAALADAAGAVRALVADLEDVATGP